MEKVKNNQVAKKKEDDYYPFEFDFTEPKFPGQPILGLVNAGFNYPPNYIQNYDFRLSGVSFHISMGTRLAVLGSSSIGPGIKSTLLNLLGDDYFPYQGFKSHAPKRRIGQYSQHFIDLLTTIPDETPVQYLLRMHPDYQKEEKEKAVCAKLENFGLPSQDHLTPMVKLGDGDKARVLFTSISMSKPNVLILDEPTKHLDTQSIDALADALDEFKGGVVLVSHDTRFISRVCHKDKRSQILLVKNNGTVESFRGSFEEYMQKLTPHGKLQAKL